MPTRSVVAGLDGSGAARHAVDLAADEARQRGAPLLILHAFSWPWIWPPLGAEHHTNPLPQSKARRMLQQSAEHIQEQFPDLAVSTRLVDGPAAVLIDHSRNAQLLLVGHRGSGGFAELLAGSVALHTAAHAACPVLVARGTPTKPDAPVVAGVDGSPGGRLATRFAIETAARRGVPLLAVLAQPTHPHRRHAGTDRWPDGGPLADLLGDSAREHPEVPLQPQIARAGSPSAALVAASADAALVVVGSRGLGGMSGLLLGSVARALIEHAHCPVAIVPTTEASGASVG